MKVITFMFAVGAITLAACNGSAGMDVESQPGICYVLCDFSKSQDSSSQRKILRNAISIFNIELANFKYRYYDIGTEHFGEPLFEYIDSSGMILPGSEQKLIEARKRTSENTLKQRILDRQKANLSGTTCIRRALDKVANSLAGDKTNKKRRIVVFILSDMLEDCNYDSVKIDIDKGSYPEAFKQLSKMRDPVFTFKDYKIEIYPVASSQQSIDYRNLLDFWKKLFHKYNYELDVISPDLPELKGY